MLGNAEGSLVSRHERRVDRFDEHAMKVARA